MQRARKSSQQRDEEMFIMYCEGYSIKQIAEAYGLSEGYVRVVSSKSKWAERKYVNGKEISDITNQKFISIATELIDNFFKEESFAYKKCLEMLHNPECYMDKNGVPSIFKFKEIVITMSLIEDRLKSLAGILEPQQVAELNMKERATVIRELANGLGEDAVIQDNFLQALNWVAESNFGDNHEQELETEKKQFTTQTKTINPKYEE